MKWIPPIPYGALYSPPARKLGSALALLGWCYDNVTTNGWVEMNLQEIAGELDTPYRTIKLWWQALRTSEFIAEVQDRGRRGLNVRLADDWIDWRVLNARRPQTEQSIGNGADIRPSEVKNEPDMGQQTAPYSQNGQEMGRKWDGNGADIRPSALAYKGTHDSQESESHESPSPTTPRANRTPDRAVVVMMYDKGFTSSSAINAIARLGVDRETIATSIDNLRADGWKDNGRIMRRLQEHPPEPGLPYPRARAPARASPELPAPPERPSKSVLSAEARRALLEQHRNGS